MKKMEFELTLRSQTFVVWEIFQKALMLVGAVLLLDHFRPGYLSFWASGMCILWVVGDLAPTLILHAQYFYYNAGWKILIDRASQTITVLRSEKSSVFKFKDIQRIVVSMGYATYHGRKGGVNIFDLYHYAYIQLVDGSSLVITCLLVNDLQELFRELGLGFVKEWRFYMWIDTGRYTPQPGVLDEWSR